MPVENGGGRRNPSGGRQGKKKGGPFGPRIPELIDLYGVRPELLLGLLRGRLLRGGLLCSLLRSLLRCHSLSPPLGSFD